MRKVSYFIDLIRPYQWYKNLVIFLPIIFGGVLFNFVNISKTFLGLLSLCLISSVNYIINDIVDKDRDKNHPEKKNRPIASKKIKIWEATIFAVLLFLVSVLIAALLSKYFLLSVLGLFLLTQFYSLYLKKEIIADIILISFNFVIRAISGALVILINDKPYISISPWLILCPFFLSLFISVGKRESEIIYLGEKAKDHREVLGYYKSPLTHSLMIITTSSLIISYALYTFLSVYGNLLLTLPVALYAIFRYLYLIYQGSEIARHPERILKDKRIALSSLLWILMVVVLIYFV